MNPTTTTIARALAGLALSGTVLAAGQAHARTTKSCYLTCGNCSYWYEYCIDCDDACYGWGIGCATAGCVCNGLGQTCTVS
jgi:hypothetical protein